MDDALINAWIRSSRAINGQMESALAEIPLTLTEYSILDTLSSSCSLRMLDLASSAMVTKSCVTRAVANLLKCEYVERQGSSTDRRVNVVSITSAGQEARDRAKVILDSVSEKYISPALEGEDTRRLMGILAGILALNEGAKGGCGC